MRGAASMAPQSGPKFPRRWDGPPLKLRNPRALPDAQGIDFISGSSESKNTPPTRVLQAAFRLDRQADAELALGRHAAAERLAHLAAELREGGRP